MDAAPVPIDPNTPSGTPRAQPGTTPTLITQTAEERLEENLKRSLWVLGVDFLIDMSSGRFGLRLRTDIPLYHGHWAPQLGFGLGILPPSFTGAYLNQGWVFSWEGTVGMRIPLIGDEPRFHIIPRAGVVGLLNFGVANAPLRPPDLKVDLGLGARVNFGGSFGVNLGFDWLIPAVNQGFVFLTTLGISV
jgi:hypothetical protein